MWIILTAVFVMMGLSVGVTVYLMPLVPLLLLIYASGIYYLGYQAHHQRQVRISDWLVALSDNLAKIVLLLLTMIGLMAVFVAIVPVLVFVTVFVYNKISDNDIYVNVWFNIPPTPLIYLVSWTVLVGCVLLYPVIMAMFFAPMLMLFDNNKPISAIKLSFCAYKKNFLPLTAHICSVILLLGMMMCLTIYCRPFLLLVIGLLPMILLGVLVAYCQIFGDTS